MRYLPGLGLLAASVLSVSAAQAQPRTPVVVIGRFSAEKTCTLYEESAGRSALVAGPYGFASSESWRTWLVKDCVSNFATIRTSLAASLASTGKFFVKTAGAGYTLSGALSQVGGDSSPAPDSPEGAAFSVSSQQIFVSMQFTLRDPAGRIVYGGLLTKHLETGSRIHTRGMETASNQSGEAVYAELQNQVALAAARLVAFRIVPLRVVDGDGSQIRLNYGSPLLTLGTVVHATSPDGGTTVRYSVISADANGATAQVDGEVGDRSRIVPGSLASILETDDPQANERRTTKVDLP